MTDVCVIGGSRYFGKRLIARLLAEDVNVTVVNRGSSPAPRHTTHLVADRDDEAGLAAALGARRFDAVIDQVCYTPRQAAIAARVFGGRTSRYVMTSTIEVYAAGASSSAGAPLGESVVDLSADTVDMDLPWHDPSFVEENYGEGKRQAEAVLTGEPTFDFTAVRSAHVLGGGGEDFTGRLAHYVRRIRSGEPVDVHGLDHSTSFIGHAEIAEVLSWAAGADFTGPVNACSSGELNVKDLCGLIGEVTGVPPRYRVVPPGAQASPFAFETYYGMDNSRATGLGFEFSRAADLLPKAIRDVVTASDEGRA